MNELRFDQFELCGQYPFCSSKIDQIYFLCMLRGLNVVCLFQFPYKILLLKDRS
jgi:hypothetical protein